MKKNNTSIKINILPASNDILFEQRESGLTHSPFAMEYLLFQAIGNGDTEQVPKLIAQYLSQDVTAGNLAGNMLKQMRYWAIASISVAIHYAILGGLDETTAFNLSDTYIRGIDNISRPEECLLYLETKALELTTLVKESKALHPNARLIRKCLHYIHIHLHERLTTSDLANNLGVSREYLSRLFLAETGESLHSYISKKKLEASLQLLLRGDSYSSISYHLSFCSESHYITCFKKQYGMTPGQYRKSALL